MRAFLLFLLVGIAAAAPSSEKPDDDRLVIDKDFYPLEWVKYKSSHDIVNILVPLNSLNFEDDSSSESDSKESEVNAYIFFVEADITEDGKRTDRGLYVMKDNKATMLLENGRDMAASGDDSKLVYLGASDGLYVYKVDKNAAEKYGSVTDDIINIVKEKEGDVIYILTASKDVFKVTDNGNVKEKVEDIVNAEEIMMDYSENLFFYSSDKQPYVRTKDGVKKVTGLPENPAAVRLIKPPILMENGVPFVVDNEVYLIYANGTSETADIQFQPKYAPTAYSPEATFLQYYAYDKKIYEYNVLAIILGTIMEELTEFLEEQKDSIRSLAMNPKSSIKARR